jgi:hypothetical protein
MTKYPKLERWQLNALLSDNTHWFQRKGFIVKKAKEFGIELLTDSQIEFFIEVHCPRELKRLDEAEVKLPEFLNLGVEQIVVKNPVIGRHYLVKSINSPSPFELVEMSGETCFLDNIVNKRARLLTCHISELRDMPKGYLYPSTPKYNNR